MKINLTHRPRAIKPPKRRTGSSCCFRPHQNESRWDPERDPGYWWLVANRPGHAISAKEWVTSHYSTAVQQSIVHRTRNKERFCWAKLQLRPT